MKRTFTLIGVGILAASLSLAGASAANATNEKTTICHATSSETNPWVLIEVPEPSLDAHEGHSDLIPAPVDGCPVPAVVPPVDVPVDPIDPDVEVPVDPPVEEPADPDVPEEPTEEPTEEPEVPTEEPTDTAEPVVPGVVPEVPTAQVELPTIPVNAELAYTGSNDIDPFWSIAIGSLLVAVGVFLMTRKKKNA